MLTKTILVVGVNAFMCIIIGMLVAVIQPYKVTVYNVVDTVLILSVGLTFAACMSLWIAWNADLENNTLAVVITLTPFNVPLFTLLVIIL